MEYFGLHEYIKHDNYQSIIEKVYSKWQKILKWINEILIISIIKLFFTLDAPYKELLTLLSYFSSLCFIFLTFHSILLKVRLSFPALYFSIFPSTSIVHSHSSDHLYTITKSQVVQLSQIILYGCDFYQNPMHFKHSIHFNLVSHSPISCTITMIHNYIALKFFDDPYYFLALLSVSSNFHFLTLAL